MWVMVAATKAQLFKIPIINVKAMLGRGLLPEMTRTELKSATVTINENVVQTVLQFLAAETLYKKLWVPIRINAMTASVYQLSITER